MSELAILSKGIEADNELNLSGLERLGLDLLPSAVRGEIGRVEGLVTLVLPLFLGGLLKEGLLFLLLLFLALADLNIIDHCGVKGFLEKAGFVLETDGHVAAEAGDLVEVHAGLTDDLLHVDGAGEDLRLLFLG